MWAQFAQPSERQQTTIRHDLRRIETMTFIRHRET
jgi:hypothetical protein